MSHLDQGRVFTEQEAAVLLKMTRRILADRRREGKNTLPQGRSLHQLQDGPHSRVSVFC